MTNLEVINFFHEDLSYRQNRDEVNIARKIISNVQKLKTEFFTDCSIHEGMFKRIVDNNLNQ